MLYFIAKALERLDLRRLRGMVSHRERATLEYFGHFCVLMHLEHLAEMVAAARAALPEVEAR